MKSNRICLPVLLLAATAVAVTASARAKPDAKTAGDPLHTAGCPDPCSFNVTSHDKREVAALLQQHARAHHGTSLSDKHAMAAVKTIKPMYVTGCADPCSFSVHTHDKSEAAALLQGHAKMHHGTVVSDGDAAAMVRRAGEKRE